MNDERAISTEQYSLPSGAESIRFEAMLIVLAFDRYTIEQIADAFQIPAAMIEACMDDPVARGKVNDLRGMLPATGDVQTLLANDAERNLQWLQNLRDGNIRGDDKTLRVRARAAEVLLDRQIPKKVAEPVAAKVPRDVTPENMDRMRGLLLKGQSHAE